MIKLKSCPDIREVYVFALLDYYSLSNKIKAERQNKHMEEEEIKGEGTAEETVPETGTAPEAENAPEEEAKPEPEASTLPVSTETKPEDVMTNPVNSVEVINQEGKVVRTFTNEVDGADFVELAKDFANNAGHMIGYK